MRRFGLTFLLVALLLLTGCGRGRALPDDPALGLGTFPTPSATPPGSALSAPVPSAEQPVVSPTSLPVLAPPRYVLPTIAAPTFVPSATPEPSATSIPTEPARPDVQVRGGGGQVDLTPFAAPPEPPTPAPRDTPVVRPAFTATPRPTNTPEPSPTPTETRVPTATRVPPQTPTPTHPFAVERTYSAPNCSATEVRGRFVDKSGRGVSGNVVRVTALHKDSAPVLSLPSRADGSYEVTLAQGPDAGRWQVQALAPGGQVFSAAVVVETTAGECRAKNGAQTIYVEYRQVK